MAVLRELVDRHDASPNRIEMKIVANLTESFALFYEQTFVTSLEKMSVLPAEPVELVGKGCLEPLHACDEISFRRFNREVIVISHHDIGV